MNRINLGFRAHTEDFDILIDASSESEAKDIVEAYGDESGYLTEDTILDEVGDTDSDQYDAITANDYSEYLDSYLDDKGLKEAYEEECPDDSCYIIDGLSGAAIGVSQDNRIIYDYNKILEILQNRDGMTEEEAREWYDFNIVRAFPYYKPGPIVIVGI